MKKLNVILFLFYVFIFSANYTVAQKNIRHSRTTVAARHHRQVAKRSNHHPTTIVAYHPGWAPHKTINRRWVYFPKHNLYWDNWRNLYFYKNGAKWVSSSTLPAHLKSSKLDEEEFIELDQENEEDDEIYLTNQETIK